MGSPREEDLRLPAPDVLETLARKLEREHVRARLFGGSVEPLRIGRFVLERPLGAGSMGVLYAARDEQLQRPVAVKVVRAEARSGAWSSRLLEEAQAMARLSHPNVATVYEAGLWEGRVYVAMELVRGGTLRAWLQERRPDQASVLNVFLQAGEGLAAAHEQGLVHLDFKPENVMVGDDGRARVVDFGLARGGPSTGEEAAAGGDAPMGGTPAYMAPEQYRGGAVDARTDVFAFSVSLHEALHGERPFEGSSLAEIQRSVEQGAVRPPARKVPGWLDSVVRRGLSAHPRDRWGSMREMLAALRKGGSRRRSRWIVAFVAVVAVVLLFLVAGRDRLSSSPGSAGDAAPPRPVRPPEATAAFERALANLNGSGPVYAELARAVELDPGFARARLYLLLGQMTYIAVEDRESLRLVQNDRASLSPDEQALLDTLEPALSRQPSDWGEAARRARAALDERPRSALLWSQLAEYETHQGELESALEHHRRALSEVPGLVTSVSEVGAILVQLGRADEGRAALSACANSQYPNSRCAALLLHLLADEGACEEMETLARQAIAHGLLEGEAQWFLASSMARPGKPAAAVKEAVRWASDHLPTSIPLPLEPVFRYKSALWAGAFDEAEQAARDLERWAERTDQRWHRLAAASLLARVLVETGRGDEAASVSLDYLERQEAWEPNPTADDTAAQEDATPFLLSVAREGGKIDRVDMLARRAAWLVTWEAQIPAAYREQLWLHGYAMVVHSKETAEEALAALPSYPPPAAVEMKTFARWGLGVAYLLTGRAAAAVPILERATRSCRGLMAPYEHTRAFAWLGRAYQETGDPKRACAAYRVVLSRWGHGRMRSVTSEQVRQWMRRLPCESP